MYMDIYNNADIDKAIKDVFEKFPDLEYDEEIHYAIYAEVVFAMSGKNINTPYSYAKSVVENILKPQIVEIIKSNHC